MQRIRGISFIGLLCLVGALVGCRPEANKPDGTKPGGPGGKAFLDKKKQVPPRLEWNTNVHSRSGGAFSFRVTSAAPFAVTVVNDAAYQALRQKGPINKGDVLLSVDSKGPTYEGKVTVPAGTSWFILANQSDQEVEIHLQCFEP